MSNKFHYYIPIFLQKIGFIVFYLLHKTFVKIEIRGRENLEKLNCPILFASNHTHELDVTVSPLLLGFISKFYPIYFVSDPKEKFKSFGWRNYIYGGIFFNVLGGYPIHSGFHDYEISLENFIDLLEEKKTVFIFPEGKRTLDGNLNRGRGGLGYLVYETETVVVPVAINTFYDMSARKYFSRKRKVVVTILPAIYPEELIKTDDPQVQDYQNASQFVMDKIGQELKSSKN